MNVWDNIQRLFNKKELFALGISVFILSLVFGFNDGAKSFILTNWIKNFVIIFLLVLVSFLFRELVIKYWAYRHDSKVDYRLWVVNRFGFKKWERFDRSGLKRGVPLGVIIAFIVTVLSNGLLYFCAVGENEVIVNKKARTGRKQIELNNYEDAIIQLSAVFANVFLMVLGMSVFSWFGFDTSMFIKINFFIAVFAMIPLSRLEGAKIFFGSRNLYVFALATIIMAFLLKGLGVIAGLALAVLIAAVIAGAYYFKWEN